MANEITVTASIQCSKGNFKLPLIGADKVKINQNGLGGGAPGMVIVGSSELVIDLSDIEVPGWLQMRNIDAQQTVLWGPTHSGAMVPCGQMRPGEPATFRLDPAVQLRLKVDPGSEDLSSDSGENQAKVQIYVLED